MCVCVCSGQPTLPVGRKGGGLGVPGVFTLSGGVQVKSVCCLEGGVTPVTYLWIP